MHSTYLPLDYSRDFNLTFDKKESLYLEKNIKTGKENFEKKDTDLGQQLNFYAPRKNLTPSYYYNNRKDFIFREIFFDQELLVKEDSLSWNWELKEEFKKIGDFNCQKASIKFRGRMYDAWFTTEIPLPFGPWKFQGLTGLILEIYDKDRVLHIVAKKVKINKQTKCHIQLDKSDFDTALTIKQYLKKKTELIKEDFARLSSRLPKGYGFGALKYDENCDDCNESVELFTKQ